MAYLVDTNVFLRLVSQKDPDRKTVLDALRILSAANEALYYTTQVLAEFWTVCTPCFGARRIRALAGKDRTKSSPGRAVLPTPS